MKLRKRSFTGSLSPEVTPREIADRTLSKKAAAEGFVLLKNNCNTLPLCAGSKIGLYGAGAVKTIKGGTGSGDVNERDSINIRQGLENYGYDITSLDWLESYDKIYTQARLEWKDAIIASLPQYNDNFFKAYSASPFRIPCGDFIDVEKAKSDGADTAIFVLSRVAGENADRRKEEGDFLITSQEKKLLSQICSAYKSVVLVINSGGLVDLSFSDEFSNIHAILYFVQAGMEGGNAFADVISGKISPSGKMTDTWAFSYEDYPGAASFGCQNNNLLQEHYEEGIYVGYRYFDTFDIPVRYCFGHGLSYTNFTLEASNLSMSNEAKPIISLETTIKNTGNLYAGKEVVQVYVSCPQGSLSKEFRRLACFGKTNCLAPGEMQQLTLSFPLSRLTSYCENSAAWILEKGTYGIWLGNSLENASLIGSLILDDTVALTQCQNICKRVDALEEIFPQPKKLQLKTATWLKDAANLPSLTINAANLHTEVIDYTHCEAQNEQAASIVQTLSTDRLIALATGDIVRGQSALGSAAQTVPGAAAETVHVATSDPWNVASIVLADGPAGLRLKKEYQVYEGKVVTSGFLLDALEGGFFAPHREKIGTTYYQYCTSIPVGTLLAQTWNTELLTELGKMIAHEMELFEVTLWLAPGMNIHRNPLCGRNFEYYSEDPLLSGILAAAITAGVQKVPGCGTTIKHFACNNSEDNRFNSNSILSERTLREIYLKGFEIAVKTSQPMSIMTSYNMINGIHAANSYDLCTKAARNEWGFAGAIMTDWTTTTRSTVGICTASGCLRAGNDMIMPGDPADHENIRKELAEGTLSMEELQNCVTRTINIILQSNQYEDPACYADQFDF